MWTGKILIVDDDPDDRTIMKDAMETLDAASIIRFAENGEDALETLNDSANGEPFCLIVLDLNMPRMNGTETLKNLKADPRFKDIPVIIYSTSINPQEKKKCMDLGAESYITKPVSFQESIDTAGALLGYCSLNAAE